MDNRSSQVGGTMGSDCGGQGPSQSSKNWELRLVRESEEHQLKGV
jgi:hypothetical protein